MKQTRKIKPFKWLFFKLGLKLFATTLFANHSEEGVAPSKEIICLIWDNAFFTMIGRKCLRPRLHYTGLHRSVAIFIPDSVAVYTTPQ
jgi:hypothetical protein